MTQALTADGGAPQKTTNSPVKAACTTRRAAFLIRVLERATSAMAPMSTRWLPETATKCDAPQAANSLSSPASRAAGENPQATPASTALGASASSSQRSAASASSLKPMSTPESPPPRPRSSTRIARTVPQTPCIRLDLPHSSSPAGVNLPTQEKRWPRPTRTGLVAHTSASRPAGPFARARPRHVPSPPLTSETISSSQAETGLASNAEVASESLAEKTPAEIPAASAATVTAAAA